MNTCIVGIGSNINPDENIALAIKLMGDSTNLIRQSSFIKTKPIGITDQADFVNGAVKLKTDLPQNDFRIFLKQLEDKLGRDRSLPKFGPRTIDLDIITWNGEIVDDDYYTRDFLKDAVEELGE